jgi:lactoylglutathione lyase
MRFVHTCIRVRDPEASVRFYETLGFERRGRLNFQTAYNLYLGLPGDGDTLELTVNHGREEPYDLGEGYNHMALIVDDLDAKLTELKREGIEPEKPPYAPGGREEIGRICFVQDPDGYRIEHGEFGSGRSDTPRDRTELPEENRARTTSSSDGVAPDSPIDCDFPTPQDP